MGNLKINEAYNSTSEDINDEAFKYVQEKGGLLKYNYQSLYQGLKTRLARLFDYPLHQNTLPQTLCIFLQNNSCIIPFQIINKFGVIEGYLHIVLHKLIQVFCVNLVP